MGGKEDLDWTLENVQVFIDQNINCYVAKELVLKGYKHIHTVYSLDIAGATDGQILTILKDRGFVFVTISELTSN